ncbi:MAG: hypothetical protein FJ040_05825 [Chloroflexi bacterium]|nr:hypothetical protein [Chloroflexota bacterium]
MRWIVLFTLMLSLLVSCGGGDTGSTNQDANVDANSESVVDESSNSDDTSMTDTDESSANTAQEEAPAGDSLWQADVNRNLDSVNSYIATFTYKSEPEGGEAQEWSWRQVVNRNPFASDTTTDTVSGQGMGAFRMIVLGDKSYIISDGMQCMAMTDENNQNEMMDPQNFMSSADYDMRKEGSGPTIDGRATEKYVGEYNDGSNTVTSIAYVDPSTEITMRWEVSGTSDTNGAKETFTWVYEMSDIDAAPTVEVPDECSAMAESSAYPMPDDAQVTLQSAEMFAYSTAQPVADVVEFYNEAMPAEGYVEAEGGMTTPDMSMLMYTKDGKNVSVMITVQDGKTNVIITSQ